MKTMDTNKGIEELSFTCDETRFLRDLRKDNGVFEFSVASTHVESKEELRVDTYYDFDEYKQHLNFDCLRSDSVENCLGTPFESLKQNMTKITEDSKILKRIVKEGCGKIVPEKAIVYCHYNSYCEMEEVPFDSSFLREQKPLRLQLGEKTLYPGFELSILSMKAGEKAEFLVDPDYAFGEMGVPPRIPPGATILLAIELYSFVDCDGADIDVDLPEEIKKNFPEILKKAKDFHVLGNDCYNQNSIRGAIAKYRKAERLLLNCKLENEEEEEQYVKLLLKIYTNLCVCYNKLKMPEKVCEVAREAFYTAPNLSKKCTKLYYHLGQAHLALNNWDKAGRNLRKCMSLEPFNKETSKLLSKLEEKKKKYYIHEKITYEKALGFKKEELINVEKLAIDFENVLRIQLKDFKQQETGMMHLPDGLSAQEKSICRRVCSDMDLKYKEILICGRESVTITI